MLPQKYNVELVCPAGSMPALKAAVDNGADCVYLGFRDGTNARNFPGLGFDEQELTRGLQYAHRSSTKVYIAINTYPRPHQWQNWCNAIDRAADAGVDALILADPGLMHYTATQYPEVSIHLSVQGSATNYRAIDFYARHYSINRVVLPRVLSLAQVENVISNTDVGVEVFGFGSLCVMVEGRCILSSYATGKSPNSDGVCSPAKSVRWIETSTGRQSRLNNVLIDEYRYGEKAGYPTLCKGRFLVDRNIYYALEEPTSLNVLEILPKLLRAGVAAIKVEGRQRSPVYVAQVTKVMRAALDECLRNPETYSVNPAWMEKLDKVAEGSCHTLGAYHRSWQ